VRSGWAPLEELLIAFLIVEIYRLSKSLWSARRMQKDIATVIWMHKLGIPLLSPRKQKTEAAGMNRRPN
jgi:hypothetical protein